jgi:nickel/cobalt transporter (NicO) family protein
MTTSAHIHRHERPAMTRLAIIAAILAAVAAAGFLAMRLAPGLTDGVWTFILEGQRELTGGMADAMKQLKAAGTVYAALVLGLISFLYGILHAVGPGHGKFIISSYALANERTVRRGILLSFMAALIQALSAIIVVAILSLVLKATGVQRLATEAWLETISWGLIAALGGWLLWRQLAGRAGHAAHDRDHHHDHAGHAHAPACDHTHEHDHVHDEHCGHMHMATPEQLHGAWSWSHAWALAFSIGIRPCTGAIGILILSLGFGMIWAGVFATFTMAIGTAITVSALAALAVGSRDLAKRIAGGADSPWAATIQQTAAIGGSAAVMILGAAFFLVSLRGGPPL